MILDYGMAWGHGAWHPLEGLDVADEGVRAVDEIVWMRIRGRASGRVLFVIARVTGLHRMQIFAAQDAPTAFGAMFPLPMQRSDPAVLAGNTWFMCGF